MIVPVPSRRADGLPQARLAAARPPWVRLLHWLIAFSVLIMVFSGWGIYNASPIFGGWRFPSSVTLGGWLGGAIQWHFAAMWLVGVGTVLYLLLNVFTRRLFRQFLPLSSRAFLRDIGAAMRGKLAHDLGGHYNAVQKAAYLSVLVALIVIIVSGLAIWKPVQLSWLGDAMGGFDAARIVHFFAMAFLIAFILVHIVMAALVPRSLITMLTSTRKQP